MQQFNNHEGSLTLRIATLALLSLVALTILPISVLIGESWSDYGNRYGHGWLILAVSIYLLWRPHYAKVQRLGGLEFGLISLAFICVLGIQFIALVMTVQVVMMNLLPVVLIFGCYLAFGRAYALFAAFPLAYLYCALPIWNYINPWLQSMTSLVVSEVLGWSGISVLIQDNFITIPAGIFEVAEGCSGFKYFISSLALSLLFAHLYANSNLEKLKVLLAGLLLALLANWVRVYVVIMIAHFTDITNPLVEDHDNLGWVIYGISLLPFFMIANFIVKGKPEETEVGDHENVSGYKRDSLSSLSWNDLRSNSRLIECSLLLVIVFALFNVHREFMLTEQQTSVFKMSEWNNNSPKKNDWEPVLISATNYEFKDSRDLRSGVSVRYHLAQFQDLPWQSDPMFYTNSVESDLWKLERDSIVEFSEGRSIGKLLLRNRYGRRVIAFYWYQVGEESIVGKIPLKLAVLKNYLFGFYGSQYYAISAYCSSASCDKSAEVLRSKLAEFHGNKTDPKTLVN